MKQFEGKTAIATGAASGMAKLFLENMAAEGANVVFVDINGEGAEAAAEAVRKAGGNAIAIKTDITKTADIIAAADLAMKTYGRIDYLLNAAGGNEQRICKQFEGFQNQSYESLEWGVDVNLRGAVLFARAVINPMIEQKSGVILNMSSVDAIHGSNGGAYGATKAGMIGLSRSLAVFGAKYGIRSVAIAPGPVLTRPAMANCRTLINHVADPQELVDFMLYLCSDKAKSITGSFHLIDGGRSVIGATCW